MDEKTSARMRRIRRAGTKPEIVVRRLVYRLGHRYRVANRDLPGSPDLANRSRRWAIFVHGCFWHRHEGCRRTTTPKKNAKFWQAKFDRNLARDARAVESLTANGYTVLTVWECETSDLEKLIRRLRGELSPPARDRAHEVARSSA